MSKFNTSTHDIISTVNTVSTSIHHSKVSSCPWLSLSLPLPHPHKHPWSAFLSLQLLCFQIVFLHFFGARNCTFSPWSMSLEYSVSFLSTRWFWDSPVLCTLKITSFSCRPGLHSLSGHTTVSSPVVDIWVVDSLGLLESSYAQVFAWTSVSVLWSERLGVRLSGSPGECAHDVSQNSLDVSILNSHQQHESWSFTNTVYLSSLSFH